MLRLPILLFCTTFSLFISQAQNTSGETPDYLQKLIDSSNVAYESGNYGKSLELNVKIVEQAKVINDTSSLQKGYRFLGYDYLILDDITLARENFEKSQKFAIISNDKKALGQSFMDLANLYGRQNSSLSKALEYHNKSIEIFKELKDTINLGSAYHNTIVNLQEANRFEETLFYLQEVDKIKYQVNPTIRASIQNLWAKYYLENEDYEKADYYLSELLQDSRLSHLKVELADGYLLYSKSLYAQQKYKEAYDNAILYQDLNAENLKKLQTEESQKIAASFQVNEYKENIEKTQLKNQLQAEIVKSQSNWNKFLILIIAGAILLLFVFYRHYGIRKDYVKNLKIKNQEYLIAKNKSEELSKAKTAFFSTVSHELRTPLYGVIGLSTILMDDPKLASHKQDLKSLKFSADYLLALINDVLQINKIDSKKPEDSSENFNLREFLSNIVSSFEYMKLQNNNSIHVHIDERIPRTIYGNATRLSQVLMNLVGNACKFTENGDISITLKATEITEEQAKIKFIISDTGIGIPEENQQSIFNEFAQVSSNQNQLSYQGTGLGLPIVKRLLALSNATLQLESTEGEGSVFYFTLDFELSQDEEVAINTPQINDDALEGKHILIVDDNRINQIVTTKILQKFGVNCSVANNGQEGIDLAKKLELDLILMDIHMPVKDGLEATQEIRLFNEQLPIIALTAVEVKEMRYKIYDAGLTDIIVKPYDITQFKQTILRNLSSNKNELNKLSQPA